MIQLLDTSSEIFTIQFVPHYNSRYIPGTQTIEISLDFALVLEDGISTQSIALTLAHEMGHAKQHLSLGDKMIEYINDPIKCRELEDINLRDCETPIALELGEPARKNYDDVSKMWYVNNPTHYRVKLTFWQRIAPWNWFRVYREYNAE